MSFDWLQYLDLASELSDQARNLEHRDAGLRSSISRAVFLFLLVYLSSSHFKAFYRITSIYYSNS